MSCLTEKRNTFIIRRQIRQIGRGGMVMLRNNFISLNALELTVKSHTNKKRAKI